MGYHELFEKYQNLETSELYDIMCQSNDFDVIFVCSCVIEQRDMWEED